MSAGFRTSPPNSAAVLETFWRRHGPSEQTRPKARRGRMRTLLTVKGVAACLRVSTKTVYRLCALGELRHIRVLNAITMAPSDVDALVFARRV